MWANEGRENVLVHDESFKDKRWIDKGAYYEMLNDKILQPS